MWSNPLFVMGFFSVVIAIITAGSLLLKKD